MATGSGWYNNALEQLMNGGLDLDTADLRVCLVNSSYTPDVDTHDFLDDVTANELSGTGYARKALTSETVAQDNTNNRGTLSADNPTWTGANFGTAAKAIIYVEGASDAARLLVAYIGFTNTVTNGGDFTLKWNNGSTSGEILRLNNQPT